MTVVEISISEIYANFRIENTGGGGGGGQKMSPSPPPPPPPPYILRCRQHTKTYYRGVPLFQVSLT